MQLSKALSSYLVQLAADGRSPHTINQAKRHGRLLVEALKDPAIAHVRHEDVAAFLASDVVATAATGGPRRASSANALRSSVRCLFAYAHAAGLAPSNAGRLVRRSKVPVPRPRALSEADAGRLLAALEKTRSPQDRRDRVLVLLLLRAGLRIGSALALDVEDLDGDRLALRRMKGGDADVAFLSTEVAAALAEHVADRTAGPMFTRADGRRLGARQAARRLAGWARRAGIAGRVSPHRLRHSFGQAVFDRSGDVLVTARALGHRSLASSAVYARPSEARVRAAIGA